MSAEHLCLPGRLLVITLLCMSQLAHAQPSQLEKPQAGTAKPGPIIEVPQADPVPIPLMTPEELPARTPLVTYRHGQLTIDSTNSTLASILNAIQTQTGAAITIPEDSSERVAVHLSGPPSLVIPELIDGSKFGYVIRSSPEDPEGMIELVLNKKPLSGAQPVAPTLAASKRMAMANPAPPAPEEQRSSAPPVPANVQAIAEMETDKTSDKSAASPEKGENQPAVVAQAGSALSSDDPHPAPPVQLTALQQTPDQAQQQQVTNRQFMQDMYTSRQKLQAQQTQSQTQ